MSKRHDCANKKAYDGDGWPRCGTCDGRIHLPGCTSRRDPRKDCTAERCEKYVLDSAGKELRGGVDSGT